MRWFRRGRRVEITLYGKPGCHLCEETLALIEKLGKRYSIDLVEVDITGDPELYRRYDIFIPVVVVDGGDEIAAPIRERDLRRALTKRREAQP
jgi:glutaredoxin